MELPALAIRVTSLVVLARWVDDECAVSESVIERVSVVYGLVACLADALALVSEVLPVETLAAAASRTFI